ncbi:MAG: hypothetical protein IKB93_16130 [Clostridia bacterium]|nr:hypothetical protein [Clostridia bacterium]
MENAFNIDDFRDLKELTVDVAKPLDKRLKQYIMDVKNPHMVRVGDILVQIEFAGNRSFSDALSAAIQI